MLFNSGVFAFFFAAVFVLYCLLPHRGQNRLLLVASYFFYGFWNVKFLGLIFLSTSVDYLAGLAIRRAQEGKNPGLARNWLVLSLVVNLTILGFFKYYGFFLDSLGPLGIDVERWRLDLILPVGISFYTFQSMSYSIDVYRKRTKPVRSFEDFALYVAFFPQLMAGPIERSRQLIPQLQAPRQLTDAGLRLGAWLILWGLFKKIFIADNLAPYTYWAISEGMAPAGMDNLLGQLAFTVQFYCDFSGYSDMACGLAACLGIHLTRNFYLPYFSSSPSELWGRWHITLSSWFRDYTYGPLRKKFGRGRGAAVALLLTMALVGLWHGAKLTFMVWGFSWGVAILLHRWLRPSLSRLAGDSVFRKRTLKLGGVLITFGLWMVLGTLFISPNFSHALTLTERLFTEFDTSTKTLIDLWTVLYFSTPLLLMQLFQWRRDKLDVIEDVPLLLRILLYTVLVLLLITNGAQYDPEFIYFQF